MSKRIELSQGKFAIVDDEDYEWINQYKWSALRGRSTFYAVRNEGRPQKRIYLHREIMNAPADMQVDHTDRDGLNCTRDNMRLATNAQNLRNRGAQANNTSGYKGVDWHKWCGKWRVTIKVNGKQIYLGHYGDPIEAARAYDAAARKYHGEFANTNFPNP